MPRSGYGAVTVEAVARQAGVSRATAARVLAGYGRVSTAARQRVLDAAVDLGYVVNPVAQALATGQGSRVVVGVVSPSADLRLDAYLGTVVTAAAQECAPAGLGVALQALPLGGGAALTALGRDRSVHGVVLVNTTDAVLRAMPAALARRTVSIGVGSSAVPSMDVDNAAGAATVLRHLYRSGRRRIAMVGGPDWLPCAARPLRAYRQLMHDAGLPTRWLAGDFTARHGRLAAQEVMSRWPDTDAVFAICDDAAMGVIHGLQELGVDVPAHVAVAGFDDIPQASLGFPPLTTATHPVELIARAAVTSVLAAGAERPPDHVFGSDLVLRQSA